MYAVSNINDSLMKVFHSNGTLTGSEVIRSGMSLGLSQPQDVSVGGVPLLQSLTLMERLRTWKGKLGRETGFTRNLWTTMKQREEGKRTA